MNVQNINGLLTELADSKLEIDFFGEKQIKDFEEHIIINLN